MCVYILFLLLLRLKMIIMERMFNNLEFIERNQDDDCRLSNYFGYADHASLLIIETN